MNNIFPIFQVEQYIIALASRKVTYSKFKFDIMIFFVHGIGAIIYITLLFTIFYFIVSSQYIRGSSNKEWDFLNSLKICVRFKLKFVTIIEQHLSNSEIKPMFL